MAEPNDIDNVIRFPTSGTRGEILDFYQQLRHEATGLRLQLRTKQEVLERSVALIDQLSLDLERAQATIDSQKDQIIQLQQQQHALHSNPHHHTKTEPIESNDTINSDKKTPSSSPEKQKSDDNNTTDNNNTTTSNNNTHFTKRDDIREAVKSLAIQDEQLLGQHDARIQGIRDFWAMKSAIQGNIPIPNNGKSPELVPSCKITMAARASTSGSLIPTPRSMMKGNNNSNSSNDNNTEKNKQTKQ